MNYVYSGVAIYVICMHETQDMSLRFDSQAGTHACMHHRIDLELVL